MVLYCYFLMIELRQAECKNIRLADNREQQSALEFVFWRLSTSVFVLRMDVTTILSSGNPLDFKESRKAIHI